jgi:hypothetical protein
VFDFDFCVAAGSPYPTDAALELEATEAGKLNAVVVWFDLHLAEGVSLTSGKRAVCLSCVVCCGKVVSAAGGKQNAVVMRFDLHLAEGVSLTSGKRPGLFVMCGVLQQGSVSSRWQTERHGGVVSPASGISSVTDIRWVNCVPDYLKKR